MYSIACPIFVDTEIWGHTMNII